MLCMDTTQYNTIQCANTVTDIRNTLLPSMGPTDGRVSGTCAVQNSDTLKIPPH